MKLIRGFVSRYPGQSLLLVVVLLLAGVADGIGLSALLPVLNLAFAPDRTAVEQDGLAQSVVRGLAQLGLNPTMGVLIGVVVVGIAVKNVMLFISEQRIGYIAANLTTELRMRLQRAVAGSRWRYFVHQSTGRLANAMATEAPRASQSYVFAVRLLAMSVETLVYITVAMLVSWRATLLCIAASLGILLLSHALVRMANRAGAGQTRWNRALLSTLTNVLQSVKSLKAMGRDGSSSELLETATRKIKRALKREVFSVAALQSVQEPLYMGVLGLGIYLAIVHFSVEAATVTFLAVVLARVLRQIGKVQKQYQKMVVSESAYWAILDEIAAAEAEAETFTGIEKPVLTRSVQLESVAFAYEPSHPILRDASLTIPAQGLTCIIGESGTGKSTLADLVIGLIAPDRGRVLVDGVPLTEVDLQAWRRQLGYVPQDTLLLNESIFENVRFGSLDVSEAEAQQALQAAGVWETVAAMPDGLYAPVGERGGRLSGGQRQRVMIARALVHQPRLLVLDEATSALDAASENAICDTLADLKQRMGVLAITHRSGLLRVADQIYEVADGSVRTVRQPEQQSLG